MASQDELTPLQRLRAELESGEGRPARWADRFARLGRAVLEAAPPTPDAASAPADAALSCADGQAALDVYVDDMVRGVDVEGVYPRLAAHLRGCQACRQVYDGLLGLALDTPASPPPHLPPPRLAFLNPPPQTASWITHPQPRLGGATFGQVYAFGVQYLRSLLLPETLRPVRVGQTPSATGAPHILLADTIALDGDTLVVELLASPTPPPAEHLLIYGMVMDLGPRKRQIQVRLRWGDEVRVGPVDAQGHVALGLVPLTLLREEAPVAAARFEVTIEGREDERE